MRSGLARLWPWSGYAQRRRGGNAIVQLVTSTYEDHQPGGSATAVFVLNPDGLAVGGPEVFSGSGNYRWLSDGVATDYQVVVDVAGGFLTLGAPGTFSLGTTAREFAVTRPSIGMRTATVNFSIEAVANPGVSLASATISLGAYVDPGDGGGGYVDPRDGRDNGQNVN